MDNENPTVLSTAQTIAAYATVTAALVSAVYLTVTMTTGTVAVVKDYREQRRLAKADKNN